MDTQTIGKRVRQIRKIKGITQGQLASLTGLSTMSIRRYEGGERIITEDTLQRIADALGVTMNDLFEPTEEKLKRAAEDMAYLRTSLALDKLNLEGKQKAVERVEELTEIPRYRAETPPAPPPTPSEDTDTAPTAPPPESPEEGE